MWWFLRIAEELLSNVVSQRSYLMWFLRIAAGAI